MKYERVLLRQSLECGDSKAWLSRLWRSADRRFCNNFFATEALSSQSVGVSCWFSHIHAIKISSSVNNTHNSKYYCCSRNVHTAAAETWGRALQRRRAPLEVCFNKQQRRQRVIHRATLWRYPSTVALQSLYNLNFLGRAFGNQFKGTYDNVRREKLWKISEK